MNEPYDNPPEDSYSCYNPRGNIEEMFDLVCGPTIPFQAELLKIGQVVFQSEKGKARNRHKDEEDKDARKGKNWVLSPAGKPGIKADEDRNGDQYTQEAKVARVNGPLPLVDDVESEGGNIEGECEDVCRYPEGLKALVERFANGPWTGLAGPFGMLSRIESILDVEDDVGKQEDGCDGSLKKVDDVDL